MISDKGFQGQVVAVIHRGAVITEQQDGLGLGDDRGPPFAPLLRFRGAQRFGFGFAGDPAEVKLGQTENFPRIDIADNGRGQVGGRIVFFKHTPPRRGGVMRFKSDMWPTTMW